VRIRRERGECRCLHASERGCDVPRILAEDAQVAQRSAFVHVRRDARVDELLHHGGPCECSARWRVHQHAPFLDEHAHVGDDLSLAVSAAA